MTIILKRTQTNKKTQTQNHTKIGVLHHPTKHPTLEDDAIRKPGKYFHSIISKSLINKIDSSIPCNTELIRYHLKYWAKFYRQCFKKSSQRTERDPGTNKKGDSWKHWNLCFVLFFFPDKRRLEGIRMLISVRSCYKKMSVFSHSACQVRASQGILG